MLNLKPCWIKTNIPAENSESKCEDTLSALYELLNSIAKHDPTSPHLHSCFTASSSAWGDFRGQHLNHLWTNSSGGRTPSGNPLNQRVSDHKSIKQIFVFNSFISLCVCWVDWILSRETGNHRNNVFWKFLLICLVNVNHYMHKVTADMCKQQV